MDTATVDNFREAFRGSIILPEDAAYDDVRALYNGMIDKRPRLIAQCTDTADVATAVRFGREQEQLIAVRGGGHNGPGLGSCDDGLLIDLSRMTGIHVEPDSAIVRAQPGCTQGDLDHATHAYGLAVPAGIVSTTGMAGLTLGGGHGYLSRLHGLTVDNLLEAEVVLADGRIVIANINRHEDLFWALRGGGGNFGIVTSFLLQAHPVDTVFAGPILWDLAHARQIMAWYRDFLPEAPRQLGMFLGLKRVPSMAPFPEALWDRLVCALLCCHTGPEDEAMAIMQSVREALPEPLMDGMTSMPFPAWQSAFDAILPKGLQWYWKGDFVHELSDSAIEVHLEHAARIPSGSLSLMHLYPIDGAVHDTHSDAMAWPCREATWSMVIAGIDRDPARAETVSRWARDYWEALHPFHDGGGYINFMMDEGSERIQAIYGANYPRLARIKGRYDPDNTFRVNQNILPDTTSQQKAHR
ncbi:FAD-binding oxidoreductase [Halomonas sp. 18H]|uniref:FAD-binding oxidoreductase n=1 Tax=Halomonas almeriensis TaxID=308163 RepID=UPI00222F1B45|nr:MULTISPECIES: FAD-binding oxidoreductase [Halomonas]MCW4152995.1 FAD-binding oxidoreductase [Halomonas sp. 18H]MDN3554322.1 FAD-binding oxidoreductase [Halomonas almeriensis]